MKTVERPASHRSLSLLWALGGVMVLGGGILFFLAKDRPQAVGQGLPFLGRIPDFSLLERGGERVSASDLKGKVWVADFIFTRCAGPCPLMSTQMKGLQKEMEGEPDIRLVSFSVDPEHDRPEVLAAYADRYEADRSKWLFLTGDKAAIYRLSEQHFHLGVAEIPEEERETMDQVIRHSTKFALVDPAGRIRGYYDSGTPAALEKLVSDAKKLTR